MGDPATPGSERSSERWRNHLREFSSVFGRLVYLSSLRHRQSGAYAHYGLECLCGQQSATRILQESHLEAFREWLALSLQAKREDLDIYLASLDSWTRLILAAWAHQKPFRHLVPPDTDASERELFLADAEAVTSLLSAELGPDGDCHDERVRAVNFNFARQTA